MPNIVSLFDIFKVKVFWDDRWLSCVSQEPYYSAFSAAQQLNRDEFNHPDSSTPSVTFLEHKLRAIQIVRQKLTHKTDVDDTTLLAMMKLGFVEVRRGFSEFLGWSDSDNSRLDLAICHSTMCTKGL